MSIENLVKEVMTYKEYPEQTPAWSGWEITSTEDNIEHLCKVCNIDWWEGVSFVCLQCNEDFNNF